jgi:hypothetical protein
MGDPVSLEESSPLPSIVARIMEIFLLASDDFLSGH